MAHSGESDQQKGRGNRDEACLAGFGERARSSGAGIQAHVVRSTRIVTKSRTSGKARAHFPPATSLRARDITLVRLSSGLAQRFASDYASD